MFTGQFAGDTPDSEEASGHSPSAGRREQLPKGDRSLVLGKVPLQSRPERVVLEAEDELRRVRDQTLCRSGLVQRRGFPG